MSTLTSKPEKKVHEGRNVKRFREMMDVKQEALADALGISQQAVSAIEGKEKLEPDMLKKVAEALKVPAEAIKNFTDERALNIINTFNDNSVANGAGGMNYYNPTFNPLDKVIELYERMLKEKDEQIKEKDALIAKYRSGDDPRFHN